MVSVLCSRPFHQQRPGPPCPQVRRQEGFNYLYELWISNAMPHQNGMPSNATHQQNDRHYRSPITLISSVHTRLIHTLSLPSTPSTSSNSTPSHQHLLAGLRQKSRSFCAIPTALLFPRSLPRISLRSLASARLQTTALPGSPARWPHLSSWLKPLEMH